MDFTKLIEIATGLYEAAEDKRLTGLELRENLNNMLDFVWGVAKLDQKEDMQKALRVFKAVVGIVFEEFGLDEKVLIDWEKDNVS